jgi:hypothetical protein
MWGFLLGHLPLMAVFTDLDKRVEEGSPFDKAVYDLRLPACRALAEQMLLVHVSGRERSIELTIQNPPHEIPTSVDPGYCSDLTRRAEGLLGLSSSAYFYAGRAHPDFGTIAMAFAPSCEAGRTGSATPFDTGGLVHPKRLIKVRLVPTDGQAERVEYGRSSEIPLSEWRDVFAQVLAAYFPADLDYWKDRPLPCDPEGLYELNGDWRAWTFEVRFGEGQSVFDRAAWCADEPTMANLRRLLDREDPPVPGDPPTALDRFFQGAAALEPTGTPEFCERLEQLVRGQVGL